MWYAMDNRDPRTPKLSGEYATCIKNGDESTRSLTDLFRCSVRKNSSNAKTEVPTRPRAAGAGVGESPKSRWMESSDPSGPARKIEDFRGQR